MNLITAVRMAVSTTPALGPATKEISVKGATVVDVAPDGTPTVSTDDGVTAPASMATDYPMTVGLKVLVLPDDTGGLVIIGVAT